MKVERREGKYGREEWRNERERMEAVKKKKCRGQYGSENEKGKRERKKSGNEGGREGREVKKRGNKGQR